MRELYLDFETYSEADLKKVGAALYAEHASTSILCCCYSIDTEDYVLLTENELNTKFSKGGGFLAIYAEQEDIVFVAHNAIFEYLIWHEIMVKKHGFPPVPWRRWKCTMAKALAHGLPGALERVGAALQLEVQKDMEGNKVMQKLCKPRRNGKRWTPKEAPEDFAALYVYCTKDVQTERCLDLSLRDLPPVEKLTWEIDQRINLEGIYLDIPAIEKAIEIKDARQEEINERFKKHTGCAPSQKGKSKKWFAENKIDLPNTQAVTVRKALETYKKRTNGAALVQSSGTVELDKGFLLEDFHEAAKTSLAKLPKMLERANRDGIVREILQYHSAHTGRWGGRGIQIHNLPRPKGIDVELCIDAVSTLHRSSFEMLYSNPSEALSSSLRGFIIAPPGEILFRADLAQMEARILAWLAGQEDTLALFRAGEDLYCREASKLYGREITEDDESERQVGKLEVLSLGYQGGIGAFVKMAKTSGVDLLSAFHILWPTATCDERDKAEYSYGLYLKKSKDPVQKEVALVSDLAKQRWRRGNDKIEEFWDGVHRSAIKAVISSKPVPFGRLTWFMYKQFLFCKLPSGRCFAYPYPKIKSTERSDTLSYINSRKGRETTYGGKLTENIVQAIQRDLLRDAIIRLEGTPYKLYFHVHDEIVARVKIGVGSIDEFADIVRFVPAWAEGIPIDVKAKEGRRYGK